MVINLKKVFFTLNISLLTLMLLFFTMNYASAEKSHKQVNKDKTNCTKPLKKADKEIVVIAKFKAKEGKEDKLLAVLHSLIPMTLKEKGCIRYELNQEIDNPRIIIIVEKWASMEIWHKHNNMEYITNYFQNEAPKLIDSKEITVYKEILP